jgi:hypothetical protein
MVCLSVCLSVTTALANGCIHPSDFLIYVQPFASPLQLLEREVENGGELENNSGKNLKNRVKAVPGIIVAAVRFDIVSYANLTSFILILSAVGE